MSVVTSNERIIESRRAVLELLLSEKNHYCMYCAQSGDCELQDLLTEYQIDHLEIPSLDQTFPVDASHEDIAWDHNRCVLCGRCVRACREISGNAVLDFQERGGRTFIGVDLAGGLGRSTCVSCGVCLEFCPTGAIFNRRRTHFAVKGKSRDWRLVDSVCAECGLLCPAVYQVWGNNLQKIESRSHGDDPGRGQLCRKGRFDPLKTVGDRLTEPLVRDNEGGDWRPAGLDEALGLAAAGLDEVARLYGRKTVWGLVSPGCSNEEIDAFAAMFRSCFPQGRLDALDGRQARNLAAAIGGRDVREAGWDEIPGSDFILEIGADPEADQPIVNSLIKRAVLENRAYLAVIGSANPLGVWAATHLAVEDRDLSETLGRLLEAAGGPPGQGGDDPDELIRRYKMARRPLLIIGPGLTGVDGPAGLARALDLAEIGREGREKPPGLIVLKPGVNSFKTWKIASAGANGGTRFRGALMLLSETDRLETELLDQLRGLDFLAAISPVRVELPGSSARVLFPKPTRLEADGAFTAVDGSRTAVKRRVLSPPAQARPAWEILSALDARLETAPADRPGNGG